MGKIKIVLAILFALAKNQVAAQAVTNHAVLIGVDHYQYWNTPSQLGENIDGVLKFFKENNKYHFQLTTLRNQDVYLGKIRQTLEALPVKKGDYVMIYLTGHGCQVEDESGKRKNTMHQAFVCYDTPTPGHDGFTGKLLLGDSLGIWLTRLRNKIGAKGQVFILAESCYSGLISRGITRNRQARFIEENISNLKGLAPLIVFSSSRAFNQTPSSQKFTLIFLSAFRNFSTGSYYDLFNRF